MGLVKSFTGKSNEPQRGEPKHCHSCDQHPGVTHPQLKERAQLYKKVKLLLTQSFGTIQYACSKRSVSAWRLTPRHQKLQHSWNQQEIGSQAAMWTAQTQPQLHKEQIDTA